jgi:surface polysaccharide O-acyltransferase-like enzyme
MNSSTPTPRHWIGHWMMLVAAIHTVYGLVVFNADLLAMLRLGFFNVVGQDSRRAAVVFFMLFGFLLAVLAHATTALERIGQRAPLRRMGWSLLLLCAVALLLMPTSGFWLMAPALWALLRQPGAGAQQVQPTPANTGSGS